MYYNFDKERIVSVSEVAVGANFIYSQFPLSVAAVKSVKVVRQKTTGKTPLFVGTGKKATIIRTRKGVSSSPIMETKNVERNVTINTAPGEFTVREVLEAKYSALLSTYGYAFSKFWYDEFFNTSSLVLGGSNVSTSTKGISIAPKGNVVFNGIQLPNKITEAGVYIETPGNILVTIQGQKIESGKTISFDSTDLLKTEITNLDDIYAPVSAFAIFY